MAENRDGYGMTYIIYPPDPTSPRCVKIRANLLEYPFVSKSMAELVPTPTSQMMRG